MKLKKWLVGIICWGLIVSFAQATTQKERLELAANYNRQAIQHYQQEEFKQAAPLAKKAFKIFTEILGEKHRRTLTSMNTLAVIYKALGRLFEALPLYEKCYRFRQDLLGNRHRDTLISLNNLAAIYEALGRLSEALLLFKKVYIFRKKFLGDKHTDTLISLNNLAAIYEALGRLSEALLLFEKGYSFRQKLLGGKHRDTLISLNNLAAIYEALGRLSEALPLYEKCYRFRQDILGDMHRDTLISLNNLAAIYKALGRLSEALPLYEKCYRFRQNILGDKHPYTLISLNNLGFIYQSLGRLSEALPLYKKCYRFRQNILGEKHPDTLTSLNNLGSIYRSLGNLSEALSLYEKGYLFRKEVLGNKHPKTLTSLKNLAYVEAEQGLINNAIKHFKQLIDGVEFLRQSGDLSTENRLALFKRWIPSYSKLSQLYLLKSRPFDAFHTVEKTKARTLLESMTMEQAAKNGLSQKQQQRVQDYQARLAFLNNSIAIELKKKKKLEREIDSAREEEKRRELEIVRESAVTKGVALEMEKNQLITEAAGFRRTLMQENPKYALLNKVQIITAETGASLIPEEALFISYLIQDNRVLVFTLDSTGHLQAKDLGGIPKLDQTLKTYHEWLSKRCDTSGGFKCEDKYVWKKPDGSSLAVSYETPDYATEGNEVELDEFIHYLNNMSRELAQKLLAPIKERLQNKKRLIISPDGALAQIPFACHQKLFRIGQRCLQPRYLAHDRDNAIWTIIDEHYATGLNFIVCLAFILYTFF